MVGPTSADGIAQPLADELIRQGLIDRLDQRWNKPLTLVAAPGGYGKTRALAQAVRHNEEDPVGIEFYVRLRPSHADARRLGDALLDALGATIERSSDEHALVERIVDELASFSPTKVVLIVDDLHVLTEAPEALALLVEVLRSLPTNSHLVLAGRKLPELPLARLEADDGVVRVSDSDLVFSDAEISELAERHAIAPDVLEELAGWPALVRLAVAVGKSGPHEYLMQEVVKDLPKEVVRALTVASYAGHADAELFDDCGIEVSPAQLGDLVPMVDVLPTGAVQPHALWSDVLGETDLGVDELPQFVAEITVWHGRYQRHDDAILLATSHEAPALARRALMGALNGADTNLNAFSTGRWLELFGGGDDVAIDDAELLLLRGLHGRLAYGPGSGDDDVAAALALFHDRNDAHGEACASVEHAFRGFLAGDVGPVLDAVARSPRLVERGVETLRPLGELTNAVICELSGDFSTALDHAYRAVGPQMSQEFAELALRHRALLSFLVGDGDGATTASGQLLALAPTARNDQLDKLVRFANGDIADVVADWSEIRYGESGNKREDFGHGVISVFIDACLGFTPDLTMARTAAWDRRRERIQLALCEWSARVMAGDEDEANGRLIAEVEELGLEDPLLLGEVRRFPISCYVAVPAVRGYFDDPELTPPLGDYHRKRLAIGRILVALRAGDPPDWASYETTPGETISSMALPWSVELACGLVLHDETRGLELADALFTASGASAQPWLRLLAEGDSAVGAGAQRLLAMLPSPPSDITTIITQGAVALRRQDPAQQVTRQRVRQLLALLVLRGSVSRDSAMAALWPDKDIVKARNNFRITLSHLRDELEPGRLSGEPSYHLRVRGDQVVLHESEFLRSDLWDIRAELAKADAAAVIGDRSSRVAALTRIAELWIPPLFVDLADIIGLEAEVAGLAGQLRGATLEAAEAYLSDGRFDDSQRLGRKLLDADPYDERAHAIVIASYLDNEQVAPAREAISGCLAALGELGVEPSSATAMLMRRAQHDEIGSRQSA